MTESTDGKAIQLVISARVAWTRREVTGWIMVEIYHPTMRGHIWMPPVEFTLKAGDTIHLFTEMETFSAKMRPYWRINNGPRIDVPEGTISHSISSLWSANDLAVTEFTDYDEAKRVLPKRKPQQPA